MRLAPVRSASISLEEDRVCVGEVSFGQIGIDQTRGTQICVGEIGPGQFGIGERRGFQIRMVKSTLVRSALVKFEEI